MARFLVMRALVAPIVIVIATATVPPTTSTVSLLSTWLDRNVPPTLATIYSWSQRITNGFLSRDIISNATADAPGTNNPSVMPATASFGAPAAVREIQAVVAVLWQPHPDIAGEMSPPGPGAPHATVPLPVAKPLLASLNTPDPPNNASENAVAPLPIEDVKIAVAITPADKPAREKQVEEKPAAEEHPREEKVYASLGLAATAVDAPVVAAEPLPAEDVAVADERTPEEEQAEGQELHASLGSPTATDATLGTDIAYPGAKQFPSDPDGAFISKQASLGPAAGNASTRLESGYVPPEKMRIAYDAPPVADRPKSIGRRRVVDENNYSGLGAPDALLEALRHMGANAKNLGLPPSLWCADFMNMVLRRVGIEATGSRAARSYLKYGKKIDEPRVGAIAIFTRGKNGGHIGIVRGTDGAGNPIIISGNHNNRVAEAVYPRSRVLAYVVPRELPQEASSVSPVARRAR